MEYKTIGGSIVGLAIIALIILNAYTITEFTYYCENEPETLEEAIYGISGGKETRLYLNALHTSWNSCATGWVKALDYIEPIDISNLVEISSKDFNNDTKIIETQYINFEVLVEVKHDLNPNNYGYDNYSTITNVCIKGEDCYLMKASWNDIGGLNDEIFVDYDFEGNKLLEEDIRLYSEREDSKLNFDNLNIEIGTITGYDYTIEDNSTCSDAKIIYYPNGTLDEDNYINTEDREIGCEVRVAHPIYDWKPYIESNITTTKTPAFFNATDPTILSAC